MHKLSLDIQTPKTTSVPNYFLDTYMPEANGEFIKVYLCLLRYASDPSASVSVSLLADKLNNTEKDILRALRYWDKENVLKLTYDSSKNLTGIAFTDAGFGISSNSDTVIASGKNTSPVAAVVPDTCDPSEVEAENFEARKLTAPDKTAFSRSEVDILTQSEEFRDLLYIAQRYIGKTLSTSDTDTLIYIYCSLKFPLDLTEYLIEYCVSLGHKSFKYIERVALYWAELNISTVEEAKEYCTFFKKDCYAVLKAFGLSNRNPVESEAKMVHKWSKTYGFSKDIIVEACNRTMQAIHQPSFEYADSILTKWNKAGVKHLKDIAALDENHSKTKAASASAQSKASAAKPVANRFNNMVSRSYVYEDIEKKLLNQ